MDSNMTLGPQELAWLLQRFYREGQAAQNLNPCQAGSWYAQCLSIVRQLGGNACFMSAILFNLGRTLACMGEKRQAVACLEASANIQQREGDGELEADCIYTSGVVVALLEDHSTARRLLEKALRRYQDLELELKVAQCQHEMSKLKTNGKSPIESPTPPREFVIRVQDRVVDEFTVTPEGQISWRTPAEPGGPLPAGQVIPWQVICSK